MSDDADRWDALVAGLRAGDPEALREFVERFAPALERVARRAIEPALQRRFGAESVAQSVCRTFLRRAGAGQFELSDPDRMWSLLVAIALTKVRDGRRFHSRRRRGVDRERPIPADDDFAAAPADPSPAPDDLAAFEDELAAVLSSLDDEERRIVELRLDDRPQAEIAREIGCSVRTVRRRLAELEVRLRGALAG